VSYDRGGDWFARIRRELSCPDGPHRGPQGPNEDFGQCPTCGSITWAKRPAGETFGWHADDCSLPVDHESFCESGGDGHPAAPVIRGFWPDDRRSPDYRR
jgi:hypothetical protein